MKRVLLILLMLVLPAQAQDPALQNAVSKALAGRTVSELKVSGNWAVCQWEMSEAGGMALFHRTGKKWELAQSGGGAMGQGELAILGVPPKDRERLMPALGAEEKARVAEVLREPQWTWLTRKKRLTDEDLEYYTAWELTLIRNEIFALHGRPFTDPELKAYFHELPWYKVRPGFKESDLSELERSNVSFISSYQKRTGKI